MSWTSDVRQATFARLPKAWQPIASYHYYRARAQLERELPIVCRVLRAGAVAVDVGANEGVYTHAFARTGARVEAFEPQPACLDILRSYEQSHANVRVHGVALGVTDGWATLVVPQRGGRSITGHASLNDGAGARHRVRVQTLDGFGFARVDVIKIDVEGRELDVVAGARATIERCRPLLLVEIEQRHLPAPMEQSFAAIAALGYDGHYVDPQDRLSPLSQFVRSEHQPLKNADGAGEPYVNNFIFTPRDGSHVLAPVS